jgi:hypothetical protein
MSTRGSDAALAAPICPQCGQTIRVSMNVTTAAAARPQERSNSASLAIGGEPPGLGRGAPRRWHDGAAKLTLSASTTRAPRLACSSCLFAGRHGVRRALIPHLTWLFFATRCYLVAILATRMPAQTVAIRPPRTMATPGSRAPLTGHFSAGRTQPVPPRQGFSSGSGH